MRSLQCARFLESARSELRTESGGRVREVTSERVGAWSFRAAPAKAGVRLEAWLDSLSIRQHTGDTTLVPDTDGLIGGRYRGVLLGSGVYRGEVGPFVPDEVAEVTDLASAVDDLFPPLPQRELRPGEAWADSAGLRIARLPDSTGLRRYSLQIRREQREAIPKGDTLPVALRQTIVEDGRIVWDRTVGLMERTRSIAVETTIPANRRIRRPVRSRLTQTITLSRLPAAAEDSCTQR